MVTWLADGGFRIGELCGLHLADLHLREGAACGQCRAPHVHVCHRDGNPNRAAAKTKHPWRGGERHGHRRADQAGQPGDDPRLLRVRDHRVPADAGHGMLLVQLHGENAGQPWAPDAARGMLRRAGTRAGLGKVIPHAFRHGFATAVLDASGGNLVIARDAGGWASATVVSETYAHADVHDPAFDAALRRVWGERGEGRPAAAALPGAAGARAGRDRLELLTALIDGPAFDPLFRAEVIRIPARHPVFRWACLVAGCERPRKGSLDMCHVHHEQQWAQARGRGTGKAAFLTAAQPLGPSVWVSRCPAGSARAGPPRTPAGCCATATTAAGITTSAARDSRAASRTGWPPRSRSAGTGPARSPSARTWRPRRWACAQATRPATGLTAGRAERRCRGHGRAATSCRACRPRSPTATRSSSAPGARRSRRCPGRADHPGRAGAAASRRDPLGPVRPYPAGTAHPLGYRLGAGPGQYLPGPRHRVADRA